MATTDALIISPKISNHSELLELMNYNGYKLNRTSEPKAVFSMLNGSILIAENDREVVVFADVAGLHFNSKEVSDVELRVSQHYAGHKILAFLNQTTSSSYLFNYILNGRRIRMKAGDGDLGITVDMGDDLEEETRYFDKVETESGSKYIKDTIEYSHAAVGASQGELIAERVLGYSYNELWSDPETKTFEYVLSKGEDKVFIPRIFSANKFKALTDHLFRQAYHNSLLDPQLNETVLPLCKLHDYISDENGNYLSKQVGNIVQEIKFATSNSRGNYKSGLNVTISFFHQQLATQLVDHFGNKFWNPGNPKLEIKDQFVLNTNIRDLRKFESASSLFPFDYRKLGVVVKAYMQHSILPMSQFYFDESRFFCGIANPLLSIAALIINNHDELGFMKMKAQLHRINYPNHSERSTFQVEMFEKLLANRFNRISLNDILRMDDIDAKELTFAFDSESIILDFHTEKPDEELAEPTNLTEQVKTDPSIKQQENWFMKLLAKLTWKRR